MTVRTWLNLTIGLLVTVTLIVPNGAAADNHTGTSAGFRGELPGAGVALTIWDGGFLTTVAADYPNVGSVWVSADGALLGYVVGAPDFANQDFLGLHPGGVLVSGTPVIVVVTGPPAAGPPPIEPGTPKAEGPPPAGSADADRTFIPRLTQVEAQIASALARSEGDLPRNERWSVQINAKIALLSDPSLASRIIDKEFFELGSVESLDGRTITIVGVFPLESLRPHVVSDINYLVEALPLLEDFMASPYPTTTIYVWNGFAIGNSGGAGVLSMEDRPTYEERALIVPGIVPYEPILAHELSHAFIGNETLTQFLELYVHHMVTLGSENIEDWEHYRGWTGVSDSNTLIHALLDIYSILGRDAMAASYQALYPLRPAYGVDLCDACRQAFIDQAPPGMEGVIAAKIAEVR